MAGFKKLLKCIGQAVCANGLKALAGAVPMGAVLYDIAENACQRLREEEQDDQIQAMIQAGAAASTSEVKADAMAVVEEVAADQPPLVKAKLAAYLEQVPAVVRQSLRRPADPSGRSVPITFGIRKPEDMLQLLPPRLPRFQAGDRPAGAGDWVLEEMLGMGGFGEVWKARHAYFDGIAPAAFKFCLDASARERLLRHEASMLNQVMRHGRHPGIVPLLDASLSSDPPCLKYEFIEGGDLGGLVRDWQDSPTPRWRTVGEIVLQLANIVAFAHQVTPPIVHRDLKPANVLVQRRADGGYDLRITDFGIGGVAALQALNDARQGSTPRAESMGSTLRGSHTPLYASPQQVRGEAPDPRDDVHALGVIWYQLLIGDLQSGPPTGLWADDLEEQGVPRELIRLLGSCVASKAEKRPATAAALMADLEKHLRPQPAPVPTPAPVKPAPSPPPPVHVVSRFDERLERFLESGRGGLMAFMLDLTNKGIGDEGARVLAASPRLANLSRLILAGCHIGDEGITALASSPHIMNLTSLDLWDNHIGDAGVQALAGCSYLENLSRLDLSRNRVGDAGAKAIAESPHMRNLGELVLVSNHIGDEGALAIAASPYLANLAWLKPLDNRITEKGAAALKTAFGKRVRVM